jgi:PAS domain S-box-containing protein
MADLIQKLPPEGWLLAGAGLVILILLIAYLIRGNRYRKLKREWIGDRIKLEDSQEKEGWLRLLTRNIPKAFWIFDTKKTIFLSPAFRELTGLEERHVSKPRDLLKYLEPEYRETCGEMFDSFLVGEEKRVTGKCRFTGKPDHWILIELFRVHDAQHAEYIVGVLEEVTTQEATLREMDTQRARLEQVMQDTQRSLVENQILMNDILTSIDEGILVLDRQFRVIYWNREMEKISGKKKEDILYKEELWTHFPHLLKNRIADTIRKTLEGGSSEPRAVPYMLEGRRDGYTFEKYLPLKNSKGQISGVIGFIKDISEEVAREAELEKSRERFELTLRAINDGIWDWNLKDNTMVFSDQWFIQLGYEPGQLAASVETFRSLIDPLEADKVFQAFKAAFEENQPVVLEFRMRHKNGSWVWIQARGSCIDRTADGKPLRAVGTHTDITERKLTEIEMVKARELAEESDRLKSSFLANMSHELRTPLNAIMGFSELLTIEDLFPEEKLNYIQLIKQNSESLMRLISDIIDLAKIESNRLEMKLSTVGIKQSIEEVRSDVVEKQTPRKQQDIQFRIEIPPGMDNMTIHTDPVRFKQILRNLCDNGYKFTEEGSVTVGFNAPSNRQMTFFVRDTGMGISSSDQEKIFRRFEQIDDGLTRKFGGTGLGLNITQNLVRLFGGKIWVTSEMGKGSTFWFTLPSE